MGEPREPERGVLICGLLVGDEALLPPAQQALAERFGPLARISPVWPFESTEYYADELGHSVRRQFVSFAEPFALDRLAEVKRVTNELEGEFARSAGTGERRPVNLDPGYITLAALVLATTKPRAHRIYLSRGIHAEVTLNYARGGWQSLAWTYPDYADGAYHAFFTQVRSDLKARRSPSRPADSAQHHTPPDSAD